MIEIVSQEIFNQLNWYTINIYYKPINGLDIPRMRYYEILLDCVEPFILQNNEWIKVFYYTQYFGPNTSHHIALRIGTHNLDLKQVEERIELFFKNLHRDISDKLEENQYKLEIMNTQGDRIRFSLKEDGSIDEDTYYWFIIHWQTGCIYFLKVLKNGNINIPDLAGLHHLQWNLMGSIFPFKNVIVVESNTIIIPETKQVHYDISSLGVKQEFNLDEYYKTKEKPD